MTTANTAIPLPGRISRSYATVALVVILGVTGCSKKQTTTTAGTATQTISVNVVQSSMQAVPISLLETGSFVADESSDVAPSIAGKVIRTPASAGDVVRAGDVLCELDHRDAEFKLAQTKAQLAEATAGVLQAQQRIGLGSGGFDPAKVPEVAAARANYESAAAQSRLASADAKRYANLIATGDVSQSVYEKMRTQADTASAQADASRQQYEAAVNSAKQSYQAVGSSQATLDAMRAQVQQAEKTLSDTTIRAPFDGFISARPVAAGEFVTTSMTVATVVKVGVLKLQLKTPEKSAAGLKIGMPVVARVAAYGDRDFQGVTAALNPSVNPDSRTFILEARFPNPNGELRPGMFATAHVTLPGTENAIFIPQAAVVRDRTTDSNQVFVIDSGKAHLRVVTLGDTDRSRIRVLSGITAGEMVAINRQSDLYDGAPVTPQVTR